MFPGNKWNISQKGQVSRNPALAAAAHRETPGGDAVATKSTGAVAKSRFGPKRTSLVAPHMSAFAGVKRTWRVQCEMSANDPKQILCEPLNRLIAVS
jgi:hypothetical protein